ncbi:MAG: 50S ribosomal protein L25, partial [Bellilinea sp.]
VVHETTEIEVEGMPGDLPEKITVDISGLTTLGQSISVGELNVSDKIEVLQDSDEVVVVITGSAPEEVEEAAEVVEEPEVIERGKKEEEEEE